MTFSKALFVSLALCSVFSASAAAICDKRSQAYRDCVYLVDSLRPEKAGQMRVFAADGSEFNAGQVQWMKAQLRKFERLCDSGKPDDQAQAEKALAGVQELLKSHHRP